MRLTRFRSALAGTLLLSAAGAGAALAAYDTTEVGWTPIVKLFGHGDAKAAVEKLDVVTKAYAAALNHTEIDKPTQQFMDDSLEQLEDFDLEGFHGLLPEERNGGRELWVRGELQGSKFIVRRADGSKNFRVGLRGPRKGLGDFSEVIRSKMLETSDGDERSFLINIRAGLGIGKLRWDDAIAAAADFGRIVSTADVRAGSAGGPEASSTAKAKVKQLHPSLNAEDAAPLALLFDAFPALSEALSQMGRVEDVRTVTAGKDYTQVKVKLKGLPERFAQKHEDFAKHAKKLGKFANIDLNWADAQGRSLMKWKIDSESLTIVVDCYVKDGQLLPFTGAKVFSDEPIDPMSDQLARTRAIITARLQLLGVVVKIKNLKSDLFYTPKGTYAEMASATTAMPSDVEVEGAALGFVPTGLIDAFIPGNIRSLTMDFLRVATKGNEKKGVVLSGTLGAEQPGGDAVIEAGLDIEALDNNLVKIGVSMVNHRLIPKDDVIQDIKSYLGEVHDAFVKDLGRYRGRVGG
ncbi:MAG: hypothetical protein RL385_3439 [Pseudomonadota bacterium]|jgi:hypothetical protein